MNDAPRPHEKPMKRGPHSEQKRFLSKSLPVKKESTVLELL